MRTINKIILHCTDTKLSSHTTTADLYKWHVEEKGWSHIGYHFYIDQKGFVHTCRPLEMIGAHALGYNETSVGICLEGGKSEVSGKHEDTRTFGQRESLKNLLANLTRIFGLKVTDIIGHNEISNKACPCFDVESLRQDLRISNPLVFSL